MNASVSPCGLPGIYQWKDNGLAKQLQQQLHKCPEFTRCLPLLEDNVTSYTCVCPGPEAEVITQATAELYYHVKQQTLSTGIFFCNTTCLYKCSSTTCSGSQACSSVHKLSISVPVITLSCCCITMMLVLIGIILRHRNKQSLRASFPHLLCGAIVGAIILYTELLLASFIPSSHICTSRSFMQHLGFLSLYGCIAMKLYRVYFILQRFKSRNLDHINASAYSVPARLAACYAILLIIWPIHSPGHTYVGHRGQEGKGAESQGLVVTSLPHCRITEWDYIMTAVDFTLLLCTMYLCFCTRKSPQLYNDSTMLSYAVCHHGLWLVFAVIIMILMSTHDDSEVVFLIDCIRVLATVSTTVALLIIPKLKIIFSNQRTFKKTISCTRGHRRVHQISLTVSPYGRVMELSCVPCGPLIEVQLEEKEEDDNNEPLEDQYTKAEVNQLISMLARLQEENESYKRKLITLAIGDPLSANKPSINHNTDTSTIQPETIQGTHNQVTDQSEERDVVHMHDSNQSHQSTSFIKGNGLNIVRHQQRNKHMSDIKEPILTVPKCDNLKQCSTIDNSIKREVYIPHKREPLAVDLYNENTSPDKLSVGQPFTVSRYALDVITRRLKHNHVISNLPKLPLGEASDMTRNTLSVATSSSGNDIEIVPGEASRNEETVVENNCVVYI